MNGSQQQKAWSDAISRRFSNRSKPYETPSHGRGQWFDPTSAHRPKTLSRKGFCRIGKEWGHPRFARCPSSVRLSIGAEASQTFHRRFIKALVEVSVNV
jgi:hypothetical protein